MYIQWKITKSIDERNTHTQSTRASIKIPSSLGLTLDPAQKRGYAISQLCISMLYRYLLTICTWYTSHRTHVLRSAKCMFQPTIVSQPFKSRFCTLTHAFSLSLPFSLSLYLYLSALSIDALFRPTTKTANVIIFVLYFEICLQI